MQDRSWSRRANPRRRLAILGPLVIVAVIAAGCGDDATRRPSSVGDRPSEAREAHLKYAQCMREHGVDMPDPTFDGDAVKQAGPDKIVPPATLEEAEQACEKHLAEIAPPELSDQQREELKKAALAHARCMRERGIENFPDPTFGENGEAIIQLGPSGLDPEDPDFKQAEKACKDALRERPSEEPATTTAPADQGWQRVAPGGDCQCSDGSEFSFWTRKANPKKVVFYLEDGGACFSAETCAPDSGIYQTTVGEGPTGEDGIFDLADERNPFADYSIVYVPYCTGDVHIGNTTTSYSPGLTVHHKGYVNGTAALDHLAASFPRATEIVVIGESAGSNAAPLYAGLASDRLPDARITAIADGSGSYPDTRRINEIIAAWNTDNSLPSWTENRGTTADRWSIPGLFIQSARHDPGIVFARHDYAYDENQASWYPRIGIPTGDLLSRIDANEAQIENAGVNLLSYIAPGEEHTALSEYRFYTEKVNGEPLVDWVTRLIAGKPVDDVHCKECGTG